MTLTATDARPRVSFESVPTPLDESLPRMDVCAFVGIASSGPLHVPVVVEDANRYRDIFGPDPQLARSERDGPAGRARLGAAVESFFANGGKRCWVVRVADDRPGGAVTNEFVVPGLVVPGSDSGGWRLATLRARAPGSWSDQFRVSATLSVAAATGTAISPTRRELVLNRSTTVVVGDLVRLDFGAGLEALVVVDTVLDHDAGLRITWSSADEWWMDSEPDLADIGLGRAFRLTDGEPGDIDIVEIDDAASAVAPDSVPSKPGPGIVTVLGDTRLHTRDVVIATWTPNASGQVLILLGDEVFVDAESLPDDHQRFQIETALAVVNEPDLSAEGVGDPSTSLPAVEVLRVNLRVWRGEQLVAALGDLGFGSGHPRSLARLPGDDELFALIASLPRYGDSMVTGDFAPTALTALQQETLDPRFPLAAPRQSSPIVLPFGIGTTHDASAIGPVPVAADPANTMERDGLAHFGAHLFVDEDLGRLGTDTLLDGAFHKAYVDSRPQRLHGVHAVLPLEEVTLLAVPDAIHPRWERIVTVPPAPLTAPVLETPDVDGSDMTLRWSSVPGAGSYEVESAGDAVFIDAPRSSGATGTALLIEGRTCCPAQVFARVRATRGDERGPWSNVESAYVPAGGFVPCVLAGGTVDLGGGRAGQSAIGHPLATWVSVSPADDYTWAELRAIHTAMLRVCTSRGDVFALLSLPEHVRTAEALEYVSGLVGRAGQRSSTGTEHADPGLLPVGVPTLGTGDEAALSYGAVYHPWIVTGSTERAVLSSNPPDGAIAGVYASRAISGGAWVAPANQPITHALALTPRFDDADRARLLSAGINPLAREPRGIVAIGTDTLSPASALRPVNVRRLMILLRRLATREGATYIFRPNDGEFRRLVQMRFERLLTDLHRRGAFARAIPEEAFEVATDASVNPTTGIDQGRFVVEIRVAPSQPMKFITVRLVMSGPDVVALAEV